jgi:CRP-like cAMP-binding protein
LHRGSATLSIRCRERRIDIKVQTTAPSLVGLPSLLDGAPHPFTAVAHGGAELSFVDRNNFACMIESDTLLSLQALGALVAEMAFTSRAILDQIHLEAENAA